MTILIPIILALVMLLVNGLYSRRPAMISANVALMAISFYVAGEISTLAPHWVVLLIYGVPAFIYALGMFAIWNSRASIRSPGPD